MNKHKDLVDIYNKANIAWVNAGKAMNKTSEWYDEKDAEWTKAYQDLRDFNEGRKR